MNKREIFQRLMMCAINSTGTSVRRRNTFLRMVCCLRIMPWRRKNAEAIYRIDICFVPSGSAPSGLSSSIDMMLKNSWSPSFEKMDDAGHLFDAARGNRLMCLSSCQGLVYSTPP